VAGELEALASSQRELLYWSRNHTLREPLLHQGSFSGNLMTGWTGPLIFHLCTGEFPAKVFLEHVFSEECVRRHR
jgi:hypothetical protein